jgi:hypothetical protein
MNSSIVKELSSVLVKNIDESNIKDKDINLITSGGAFNASYLVGCLYVIREMREKGLIRINKISTCSGSAILGLLFLVDKLDMFVDKLYDILVASFKKNKIVIFDEESLLNVMKIIEDELPEDVISIINNKLYITYYDVLDCKQIVKSEYKDVNDIFNTIRRSCFIPYLTMNKFLEDNRYVDGGTPYIFDKEVGVKRLYINLCGMDKIKDAIVIKKDKIVMHRILGGVIDIHNFFFRCKKTSMCNYVEDWDIIRLMEFKLLEIRIFSICVIIYIIIKVKSSIVDKYYNDNKMIHDICKKCRTSVSKIIEMYCV